MHEVLVNRLGGLSLPKKSVVRLTDRPDTTLDVYCGRKTTMQQQQPLVGGDNPQALRGKASGLSPVQMAKTSVKTLLSMKHSG